MKTLLRALAGLGLLAAAVPANAGLLYGVHSGTDTLEVIDTTTFVRTTVGSLGVDLTSGAGLAYDPNSDRFFATDILDNRLYSIDRNTGTASIIGNTGLNRLFGLAFDSQNNVLYGVNDGPNSVPETLVVLDTATGASTTVATLSDRFFGLAYDSTRDRLLGLDTFNGLFEIDRTTGVQTLLNNSFLDGVGSLAYDPDRDLFWASDAVGGFVTFDPNNGFALTAQPSGRIAFSAGLAFVSTATTSVPEPSSLAAIGVGLFTIGVFARRRRKV